MDISKLSVFPPRRKAAARSETGAGTTNSREHKEPIPMVEIVKRVDLIATFDNLKKAGDTVEIRLSDATESNVRSAASRYSQRKKVRLVVAATLGADSIKVMRDS